MKGSQAAEPKGHSENAEFSKRDRFDASELPERRAIALAQRGDPSAFERLYQLHSARVYALCLRMTGNTAEAEDLMQDVFLMVFCKIHTFRGDSAFSTWLHRIAVNLTLMRLRKKHSLGTSLQENSDPQNDRLDHREELAVADPLLTGSLDRLHLHRAMQKLCPSQILVVVLHDLQGYKHTEIANMLDWSIGNSKSHLHRARARLRKLLEGGQRFDGITHSRTAQAAFGA